MLCSVNLDPGLLLPFFIRLLRQNLKKKSHLNDRFIEEICFYRKAEQKTHGALPLATLVENLKKKPALGTWRN